MSLSKGQCSTFENTECPYWGYPYYRVWINKASPSCTADDLSALLSKAGCRVQAVQKSHRKPRQATAFFLSIEDAAAAKGHNGQITFAGCPLVIDLFWWERRAWARMQKGKPSESATGNGYSPVECSCRFPGGGGRAKVAPTVQAELMDEQQCSRDTTPSTRASALQDSRDPLTMWEEVQKHRRKTAASQAALKRLKKQSWEERSSHLEALELLKGRLSKAENQALVLRAEALELRQEKEKADGRENARRALLEEQLRAARREAEEAMQAQEAAMRDLQGSEEARKAACAKEKQKLHLAAALIGSRTREAERWKLQTLLQAWRLCSMEATDRAGTLTTELHRLQAEKEKERTLLQMELDNMKAQSKVAIEKLEAELRDLQTDLQSMKDKADMLKKENRELDFNGLSLSLRTVELEDELEACSRSHREVQAELNTSKGRVAQLQMENRHLQQARFTSLTEDEVATIVARIEMQALSAVAAEERASVGRKLQAKWHPDRQPCSGNNFAMRVFQALGPH